jgi:fatty acid desaturase
MEHVLAGTDSREWQPPPMEGYHRLSPEVLRPLQQIDDLRSAAAVAFDLLVIALTIAAAKLVLPLWCYPLCVLVIGARQQGMIVLLHEASHRKLFSNRRVNDFVGEVLISWPLFISMISYRANHFAHHRFMNTELDPDWMRYLSPAAEEAESWRYERSRWQVLRPLLLDFLGFGMLAQIKRAIRLSRPRNHDPRRSGPEADEAVERRFPTYPQSVVWGCRLALAVGLTIAGAWPVFLLYWLVPLLTMLKMCTRLRLLAGHFAIYGGEGVRTTLTSPLGRFFLGPHAIGYHVEHHLYPAVYFQRLPELHRLLVARGDYDGRLPLRITRGYWELIADWTRDAQSQRATLHAAFPGAAH